MGQQQQDVGTIGDRVEAILADLAAGDDPRPAAQAEELVRLLVELYGAGLREILTIAAGYDSALPGRLVENPLVASLLLAHDLHPVDVDTRVRQALDQVRPYLGSHAGGVRYHGIDAAGVVQLSLEGNCHGCPSSTVTVRQTIERAVQEAAPELIGVEVAGQVPEPVGPPLLQIGRRPPVPTVAPTERCQLCATPVDERHGHLVDLEQRSLTCACRACYLLFTAPGAGRNRYHAIPDRVRHDPDHQLSTVDWEELRIPVGMAFFFRNSASGQVVASYPSPAGATECELDLSAWDALAQRYPLLQAPEPDVEGILVRRDPTGIEMFLIPIDACYALVGEVRRHWRGLDGGAETRAAVDEFLSDLRRRSQPLSTSEV